MIVKNTLTTLLILISATSVFAQDDEAMKAKLDFLVGEWKTESFTANQETGMPGHVVYKWIENSNWMLCNYVADSPKGKWGAVAMFRWNPKAKCYEAHGFMGKDEPVVTKGHFVEDNILRFKFEMNGQQAGLDIYPTEIGVEETIWILNAEGEKVVVMKSPYYKIK